MLLEIWQVYKLRLRSALWALGVSTLILGIAIPLIRFGSDLDILKGLLGVFLVYMAPQFGVELLVSGIWSLLYYVLTRLDFWQPSRTWKIIAAFVPGFFAFVQIPGCMIANLPSDWSTYSIGWPAYALLYSQVLLAPAIFCWLGFYSDRQRSVTT